MPSAKRSRRGASLKHLVTLTELRRILRAHVDPEKMLRGVAQLLAVEIGHFCLVDVVDRRGAFRRLEIQHADASLHARLRVACDDTRFSPGGRVARLFEVAGSELVARVTDGVRKGRLADITLVRDEGVKSYMAAAVVVNGAPMAVLTLVATHGTRRYDADERAFLEEVADWVGLGLENALRREAQPRTSLAPPELQEDALPASRHRTMNATGNATVNATGNATGNAR
jgi:GAF domain-containing protein